MYTAYFDCSGLAETHAGVAVAGCVSAGEQWERLEPEWNRILEQERVREIGGFKALHVQGLAASKRWTSCGESRLAPRERDSARTLSWVPSGPDPT